MLKEPDDFKLVEEVESEYDADLLLYIGPIARPTDDFVIDEIAKKKRRKNALLILATLGGNPHAAYRITRALQLHYSCEKGSGNGKVMVYVNSVCASAGTLMAMGAEELILSDHAELGPIDIQLNKTDEVGERMSGLTPVQAVEYLQQESQSMFADHFNSARNQGFGTTTAAKIAADLTVGLLGQLYQQIDPIKVAENFRSLRISQEYANRIAANMQPEAIQRLVHYYPTHDFVIDPQEARSLFEKVVSAKPALSRLGEILKVNFDLFLCASRPNFCYLSQQLPVSPTTPTEAGEINQPPTDASNNDRSEPGEEG